MHTVKHLRMYYYLHGVYWSTRTGGGVPPDVGWDGNARQVLTVYRPLFKIKPKLI